MGCLLLTALIWGFAFVSQVQGMDSMTPLFFNATRFTLGAVSLIPLLWWRRGHRRDDVSQFDVSQFDAAQSHAVDAARQTIAGDGPSAGTRKQDRPHSDSRGKLRGSSCTSQQAETPSRPVTGLRAAVLMLIANPVGTGVICGVFLFMASTLQQYGILYGRSAGRAGFITALYIVMVPLLAFLFLHRRVGVSTIFAVALSVVGFYMLCVTDGFGSLTLADWLLLFTAVLFAAHILVIDTLGSQVEPLKLSFVQFVTTATLSWIGSMFEGSVNWQGALAAWPAVLYAGIGSVGVAYTLQAVGQQWVPPTSASLIMSLESLFSVLGGALLLSEMMTPRGYIGCALIFAGTMLAQVRIGRPSGSPRPAERR